MPLGLLLSGCLTLAAVQRAEEEQTAARLLPFHLAEHAWAMGTGATVTGTVVLDTRWSEYSYGRQLPAVRKVLTCAGRAVRLIPDTPHMRWMLERRYMLSTNDRGYWSNSPILSSNWSWPVESRPVVRESLCGPAGAFRFDNVPDGPYLVMALIEAPQASETRSDTVLKPVVVRARDGRAHLDVRLEDSWLDGAVVRH